MTDEEHELYQRIDDAVHELVTEMLKGVAPIPETEIRQLLTETFRFWSR